MKILPIVKSINSDILATGLLIKQASVNGYAIAERTAGVYKQNSATRYANITRSVCDKLVKSVTLKELPYFAAAIGMLSPIPFAGPIMFGIGYFARYSIPKVIALYNKINKS